VAQIVLRDIFFASIFLAYVRTGKFSSAAPTSVRPVLRPIIFKSGPRPLHAATTEDNNAATEDDKTKKGKYFTMPVVGKKSSYGGQATNQFIPSKHSNLYSEYVMPQKLP
jgi:hypothetical protein